MTTQRPVSDKDLQDRNGKRMTIGAPPGQEHNVAPAEVLVGMVPLPSGGMTQCISVPFTFTQAETLVLSMGGTLWIQLLTNQMPPLSIDVTP